MAVLLALQLAYVHPLELLQVRVRGQLPLTDEAVPAEQRFVVGAEVTVVPCALPQAPLVGVAVLLALQFTGPHPFTPLQVQSRGHVPVGQVIPPTAQYLL